MMPIPAPAATTAQMLEVPMSAATVEASPKTPLPITELITSAVRLQRPMARTSGLAGEGSADRAIARLYHNQDRYRSAKVRKVRDKDFDSVGGDFGAEGNRTVGSYRKCRAPSQGVTLPNSAKVAMRGNPHWERLSGDYLARRNA